jgi:hypothetical protein
MRDNRQMAAHRLEMLLEGPTSVAVFGEAVITVVAKGVTAEGLRVSIDASRRVARLYPGRVVGVNLVYPGIELPNHELRRLSSEAMAEARDLTRCAARVFLGNGFWLSTVRSVLTAIELIRPYDLPRRTFSEIPPATRWLAKNIDESLAWADRLSVALGRFGGSDSEQSQQV